MSFLKYPHLERLGGSETEGILLGKVYAFYKIDGTNASIWYKDRVRFGSRNRELSIGADNAGFMNHHVNDEILWGRISKFFRDFSHYRLYGEWLVPHSLTTYRDDAWKRFYVFDVYDTEKEQFLSYEAYKPILDDYGFDYIPPLAEMVNPSVEQVIKLLDKTGQFLVKDGAGNGEGIVLKNYGFQNKYGRVTWAKVISNEFKEVHHKAMGAPLVLGTDLVEDKIVDEYVTDAFILKEKAKIELEHGGWTNRHIPELLGRVFHELVREEAYNFVKKHKQPTVNFRTLNQLTVLKVKKVIGL